MKQIILFMLMSFVYHLAFSQNVNSTDTLGIPQERTLNEVVVTARTVPYKLTKGGLV